MLASFHTGFNPFFLLVKKKKIKYDFFWGVGKDAQEQLSRMPSPSYRNVNRGVHLSHLLSVTTHLTAANSTW